MSTNDSVATPSVDRFIGRVKWFNNKTGYGFITVTDGPRAGSDVFVHHSGIMVSDEQYKYLVQGEYIGFRLDSSTDSKHEVQAVDISGINGGKLMCETRRDFRQAKNLHNENDQTDLSPPTSAPKLQRQNSQQPQDTTSEPKTPRSVRAPSSKGQGPRDSSEWKLVKGSSDRDSSSSGRGAGSRGGRGAGRGGRGRGGSSSKPTADTSSA